MFHLLLGTLALRNKHDARLQYSLRLMIAPVITEFTFNMECKRLNKSRRTRRGHAGRCSWTCLSPLPESRVFLWNLPSAKMARKAAIITINLHEEKVWVFPDQKKKYTKIIQKKNTKREVTLTYRKSRYEMTDSLTRLKSLMGTFSSLCEHHSELTQTWMVQLTTHQGCIA